MAAPEGLNLNYTTHYNQWVSINTLNTDPHNSAAVASRPVYGTRAAKMSSDLVLVDAVAARANADISGITKNKDASKLTAAQSIGVITANALSFAIEYNMVDLQKQMQNATESKLFESKDTNFVAKWTSVNKVLAAAIVANPVTAIEYFTTVQLAAAAALVVKFKGNMGVYKAAVGDVNSAKNEFKTTWMPIMKGHVTYMVAMLPGAITTSFPDYAGAFLLIKKLDNKGKRDQGLTPTMVDSVSGKPLPLIASFEPTNYPAVKKAKIGKNDASGNFKLMKLKVGLWTILFSATGYVDQIIIVKISVKEVMKITVKMVAEKPV